MFDRIADQCSNVLSDRLIYENERSVLTRAGISMFEVPEMDQTSIQNAKMLVWFPRRFTMDLASTLGSK